MPVITTGGVPAEVICRTDLRAAPLTESLDLVALVVTYLVRNCSTK